jgi:CHASE2 domain-containing sensor protein
VAIRLSLKSFDVRAVIGVLIAGAWGFFAEQVPDHLPFLRSAQLACHQVLSQLNPHASRVQWVSVVEIDDSTYYRDPFNGISPLNRKALGDLVLHLRDAGARVIALDITFIRTVAESAEERLRTPESQYLLKAIDSVSKAGTPVVLSTVLHSRGDGEMRLEPGVYLEGDVASRVYFGHINMPFDPRRIPTRVHARTWDGSSEVEVPSFAEQIVRAYEAEAHIKRTTADYPRLRRAEEEQHPVYGGFMADSEYDRISARDVLSGSAQARDCCRGRIVLVGGTWHLQGGRGDLIERFPSPVGHIPGVYMHANYVEALSDRRFWPELPRWAGLAIDMTGAILIYFAFLKTQTVVRRELFFALVLASLCLPYVIATNMGLYLDFVAGLVLCLIHLGVEYGIESRHGLPAEAPVPIPVGGM